MQGKFSASYSPVILCCLACAPCYRLLGAAQSLAHPGWSMGSGMSLLAKLSCPFHQNLVTAALCW